MKQINRFNVKKKIKQACTKVNLFSRQVLLPKIDAVFLKEINDKVTITPGKFIWAVDANV